MLHRLGKAIGENKVGKNQACQKPDQQTCDELAHVFLLPGQTRPRHCSTIGPPQTGEMMEADRRKRKNLPIRGPVAIAARRFALMAAAGLAQR